MIPSDDAGQFNVGDLHALCWIHAERNVRKLDGNNPYQHKRVAPVLDRMWKLYRSLARYRNRPTPRRKRVMETRFDQIFGMRTGYASLDRLLERVKANKDELLVRRGKALSSSGCESRAATVAPAGSSRAVHGGNDMG